MTTVDHEQAKSSASEMSEEDSARTATLRRQQELLLELALCDDLHGDCLEAALETICERAGDFLAVERTGIWVYNDDRTEIHCLDLYMRATGEHAQGMKLSYEDNPAYFDALALERAIAAHDAHTDPRTADFSAAYLTPLGISSMLDAPIRGSGRMLGVICHEHVGEPRAWSEEEQGFAASIGDCTALVLAAAERRRMQEQLLQAQKLESIGMLAGGIAHDFNNILTTIMGGASHALNLLGEAHPASRSLSRVVLAAERAADLTHQMLAYSGKGHFDIRPLQLSRVAAEIAELLHTSLPKKVRLTLDLAEGLPFVEAESAHLQQILMNLIINGGEAIDAASGCVEVRTGSLVHDGSEMRHLIAAARLPAGSYVFLDVQDDGQGMDQATLSRIFDPYFSTKLAGRGLGLAAVVGIVHSLGGAIRVISAPGKGSTFTVLFPATEREAAEDTPVEASPFIGSGVAVLVDDEEDVRKTVRVMLEGYGFEVVEAADGGEGLDRLFDRLDEVALVVLDVMMPVFDGLQVLDRIQESAPQIPVVLMSGCHDPSAAPDFSEGATVRRIPKPFNAETLAGTLAELLGDPQSGLLR
ncbi:MAG: response regulator [Myxococcota bacterium]